MRPMDAGQLALSRRAGVRPVPLFVLTTYSNRDAGTVAQTFYWSDRYVQYDWEDTGTVRQFLPMVRSHRGPDLSLMQHIQDNGASLRRSMRITLSNRPTEHGAPYLATTLRAQNLLRATFTAAIVLLDAPASEVDLTGFAGTEHTILFRGELTNVGRVDAETMELEFEAVEPTVPWLFALGNQTDPEDFGKRLPIVYGRAKRVECVGIDVGGFTTVAAPVGLDSTSIELTDTTRLSNAGTGYLNGERITWTSKTTTQILGVTKGTSGTAKQEHAAGVTLLEVRDSTFAVAGHVVNAIGTVFVRQFNGQLVRVVAPVTKNVSDAAASGFAGTPIATIRLPQAQFEELIEQIETTISLAQQPSGTATITTVIALDGDNVTSGSSVGGAPGVVGGWRVPNDYPFQSIPVPTTGTAPNSTRSVTFAAAPGGGTVLSQSFSVRAHNLSGGSLVFRFEAGTTTYGAAIDAEADPAVFISGEFTVPGSTSPSSPASFSFSTPGNVAGIVNIRRMSGGTTGGLEIERTASVLQESQVPLSIGTTDATKGKIGAAASRGTGFRLQLFADVDGPVAPSADYSVPQGTLIEGMSDVLRHFIAVRCGLGLTAADDASFDLADQNLSGNVHAGDLRDSGTGFYEMVSRLAWESRANVVAVERATGTRYLLLCADKQYRWPGPVEVVDQYGAIEERSRPPSEVVTRFRALFLRDQSRGGERDQDGYAGSLAASSTLNQVTKPSTSDLSAAEARWGRRDSRTLQFAQHRDANTLADVLGFFAGEWTRDWRLWTVRDVPWIIAFRLEPGDVVDVPLIPWAPGEDWHARTLGVEWNPDTGMRSLSLLQLSASSAVASLVARATITAAAVVQATVLAQAALSARATVTAVADTPIVPVSAGLAARATMMATLTGGVELAAAMLSASATFSAATSSDGDLGQILGLEPETVAGEPQSLAHRGSIDFATNESLQSAAAVLGFGNAWSLSLWFVPDALTAQMTVIDIHPAGVNTSRILVDVQGNVANDPLRVQLWTSAAVLFKAFTWDSPLMTQNAWRHILITWDGTTLALYANGELRAATATPTNNAGTMADDSRVVSVGTQVDASSPYNGQIHSVAIWDVALSANAVKQVWNQGDAGAANLLAADGDYDSQGDLVHWWRLGHALSDIGGDYAGAVDLT